MENLRYEIVLLSVVKTYKTLISERVTDGHFFWFSIWFQVFSFVRRSAFVVNKTARTFDISGVTYPILMVFLMLSVIDVP